MQNKIVSHYNVVKEIGRGGMAEVYEAIDLNTQRHVALKVLLPHLSSDTIVRKRFLREAKVGIELEHPGIVKVYEVGEEKKRPFIAMELVKGETLDEVMRNETFDIERSIDITLKVIDALAAAHKKKIIHRDIKPKNIMVSKNMIKVMDFGLARIQETSSLTDKYEILGTLYYMSPQQVTGDELDERTDIFSMGVVLYQMLTGILPFSGEHPGTVLHAILYSDPLRMIELGKKIPVQIEQVVFKSLRKRPHQRYQSVNDLKTDLKRIRQVPKGQQIELIATEEVFEETPRGIYSELIGRENEMRALENHFDRMMKGESSTIMVSGEVGIGKSRLVWEMGKKVKTMQARYLVGRCLHSEMGFPYKPIIEIIRGYFALKDLKEPESITVFLEEKAPHLVGRLDIILALLMITGKDVSLINKEQLWDTITEIVKLIAQDRPLLMHIEDLQWADQATLNLLTFLARNTSREKVLIIGTYRPEELTTSANGQPHPLHQTLELLNKFRLSREIILDRLDIEGTKKVTHSVFSDGIFPENLYDMIHRETEGNPLFIVELLEFLRNTGFVYRDDEKWRFSGEVDKISIPRRISEVITNRLQKLSEDERQILSVAAVEGEVFHTNTLTRCLRVSRMKVLRYLQNLESSHHLIHATETDFIFDHGKIRDVVYDSLIAELRKEYHTLIAEHFCEFYSNQDEHAVKIAHHLVKADKEKDALDYFIRAGKYAKLLFANEEAIKNLSSALEIVNKLFEQQLKPGLQKKKLDILKERAEIHLRTDNYDASLSDYEEVSEIAEQLDNQQEIADAILGIGTSKIKKGDHKIGLDYHKKALMLHKQIGNRIGEGHTLQHMAIAYWECGDMETALKLCGEALEIANETGDKMLKAGCFMWFGGIYHILGEYEKSITYCKDGLSILKKGPDRNTEAECLHAIAIDHHFLANFEESLQYADKTIELCKKIGNRFYEAWGYIDNAINYRELGQYREALCQIEKAGKIYENINAPWGTGRCLMVESWIHDDVGNHVETLRVTDKGIEIARQTGDKIAEAFGLTMAFYANAVLGNWDAALRCCEQAREIIKQYGPLELKWHIEDYGIKFWIAAGNIMEAKKNLESISKVLSNMTTTTLQMNYCVDKGLVALAESSFDKAHRYVQQALSIARRIKHARGINQSLILLAKTEYGKRNLKQSEYYAREAATMAEEIGRNDDIVEAHLLLGQIYLDKSSAEKAINHAKNAQAIADKYGMKVLLWQTHYLLGKIYTKNKKHTEAQNEYKKAKQIINGLTTNLSKDIKDTYLHKKELRKFYKDLKNIKSSKVKKNDE